MDLGAGNDTVYLSTTMSIVEGGNGTDTAVIRAFDGFVDVNVEILNILRSKQINCSRRYGCKP